MRLFKLASAALSLLLISSCAALAEEAAPAIQPLSPELADFGYVPNPDCFVAEDAGAVCGVIMVALSFGIPVN